MLWKIPILEFQQSNLLLCQNIGKSGYKSSWKYDSVLAKINQYGSHNYQ